MDYARLSEKAEFPSVSRISLLLFCTYVVIWYLQIGNRMPALGSIRFEFIFAAFLGVVAVLTASKRNLSCPLYGYVALFFLALIIQLPFSYDPAMSWEIFIDRVLKFACMGLFIVLFVRNPTALTFFLAAFLLACLKMGQEGLYGKLTGSMMWQNQGTMRLHGATPLYRHPNSFSGMALGTVPFILALWPIAGRKVRIFLFILFALSLNIIVFTGSRTGYVGFAILVLYAFWKSPNKMRYFLVAAVACILAIPFVPHDYVERFQSIFTLQEKEGSSAESRIQILKDSIEIFKEHPFGVGVGAFPQVRLETFGRLQDTHNLYLQVATNLGIQGLIIFLVLLYKATSVLKHLMAEFKGQSRAILEALPKAPDKGWKTRTEAHLADLRLLEATAKALLLFLVVRLVLGLFGHDLYEIYWWFSLGLIIALYNMNKAASANTKELLATHGDQAD